MKSLFDYLLHHKLDFATLIFAICMCTLVIVNAMTGYTIPSHILLPVDCFLLGWCVRGLADSWSTIGKNW